MAVIRRQPKQVIHHSDQGSRVKYTCDCTSGRDAGEAGVLGRRWARWGTLTTTPCAARASNDDAGGRRVGWTRRTSSTESESGEDGADTSTCY